MKQLLHRRTWQGAGWFALVGGAWVVGTGWLAVRWGLSGSGIAGQILLRSVGVALGVVLIAGLIERAERGRRRATLKLNRSLMQAHIGVARATLGGRLRSVNPHLCEILGRSEEQMLQLRLMELAEPGELEAPARLWQELQAGTRRHGAFEVRCVRPDGQWVDLWVSLSLAEDRDQGGAEVLCVAQDISQRRQTEQSERLAAAVVASTREGVMVTDPQLRIVSINRAFTEVLGYREEEVIGRSPRLMRSGRHDRTFYTAMWESIREKGHWQGEIWNRRKDGAIFPELLSISEVRAPDGQLTHYVGLFTDISRLKASEEQLEFLAHHDPLTRLPNRRRFEEHLQHALAEAQRSGARLALLMLDLDRFKDINDSWGHLAGDEWLQHVAERLGRRVRAADLLARLGGDEFVLVMQHLGSPDDAARLAAELITALGEPWQLSQGVEVSSGASVGISLYPDHGLTPQRLLQGADAALYRAKADGGGTFRYFSDEMTQEARERLHIEGRLRRAVSQGQLKLVYQPQLDLASGRIIGAEALLRWFDPVEGMIPPDRFIPVAEASGLISELGLWVLREACGQGRRWQDEGLPPLTLAVNVAARQLQHGDLVAEVQQALSETGFPAERLELELTESSLMSREGHALATLQRLRHMGVRVAVDDFGTGYSSLAYLKRFPLDVLKIDRRFIADIPHDREDMEIASAVIAMGHSLRIQVLAEGVETPAQLEFLRLRGCDRYQGFVYGHPLDPEAFAHLLGREQQAVRGGAFCCAGAGI